MILSCAGKTGSPVKTISQAYRHMTMQKLRSMGGQNKTRKTLAFKTNHKTYTWDKWDGPGMPQYVLAHRQWDSKADPHLQQLTKCRMNHLNVKVVNPPANGGHWSINSRRDSGQLCPMVHVIVRCVPKFYGDSEG